MKEAEQFIAAPKNSCESTYAEQKYTDFDISSCISTEQRLAQKYGLSLATTSSGVLNVPKTAAIVKKSIPKSNVTNSKIKKKINNSNFCNEDDPDCIVKRPTKRKKSNCKWDSDFRIEEDQEMLLALSALEEYPEINDANKSRKRERDPNQNCSSLSTKHIKIDFSYFTIDENGYVHVFISGHCENIGSWNGIAGYGVYFGDNHPLNTSKAATGRMTHNVGDIEAAIYALYTAKQNSVSKICLHTNSEFLFNASTSWMHFWKNSGWRNKSGKVVQNRKELEKLHSLLNDENIEVIWKNVTDQRDSHIQMDKATQLARMGSIEYLEQHPSKDDSFDFDFY